MHAAEGVEVISSEIIDTVPLASNTSYPSLMPLQAYVDLGKTS